jgi:hypothetical protein
MKLACLALVLAMALPSYARAQPARIAIAPIEGAQGESTRRALAEALRARGEVVVPFRAVDAAKARHGNRTLRIMATLDADLLIDGEATRTRTDLRMFRRGVVRSVHLRSSARDPEKRLEALLARYETVRAAQRLEQPPRVGEEREVEPAEAPPEPEVEPQVEPQAEPQVEPQVEPQDVEEAETEVLAEPAARPEPKPGARRLPRELGPFPRAFEGGVMLGLVSRKLRFRDDIFDRVGGYTLSAAPAIALHGRAFPFNSLRVRGLEDVGISLRGEQDFIESSGREGVSFRTYGARWDLDLLYRFPLGRFQTALWLGYYRRVFSIDAAIARPGQDNLPGVPNVRYEGLRLGGEGRAHVFRGLFVDLRLSYVAIFGAGAIHSELWFPHARAGAFELGGDLVYRLTSYMDARLGVHFERVHHQLEPEPGDRYIVGGAADRFTVLGLGLGFYR